MSVPSFFFTLCTDDSWKEKISQKFSISYVPSQTINWTERIYGETNNRTLELATSEQDDEVGGLFHVAQRKKIDPNDQEDYTLQRPTGKHDWDLEEVSERVSLQN